MKTITYNPETHVLVPREPSQGMIDAMPPVEEIGYWAMYEAAIEAAPQPEPVESEPAMWVMKHIRSGDLAQAKPNQKALHPYMWSDAFPRYTTPQPDRTAELEAALKVARDELYGKTELLKSIRDVIEEAQTYCEGPQWSPSMADECKAALAKINEVLK